MEVATSIRLLVKMFFGPAATEKAPAIESSSMKLKKTKFQSLIGATTLLIALTATPLVWAESALWDAITMGKYEQADKLIRFGLFVNVNQKNAYGNPLIHHAVSAGTPELVELLISKGADVNAKGQFDRLHSTMLTKGEWQRFY